jgi:hypothetical protein
VLIAQGNISHLNKLVNKENLNISHGTAQAVVFLVMLVEGSLCSLIHCMLAVLARKIKIENQPLMQMRQIVVKSHCGVYLSP